MSDKSLEQLELESGEGNTDSLEQLKQLAISEAQNKPETTPEVKPPDEKEVVTPQPAETKPEVDTKVTVDKQPEVTVKPEDKTEVPQNDRYVKVTDKFIQQQTPDLQRYLAGIKGDTMSERALRNYINAQAGIERLKAQTQQQAPPQQAPKTPQVQPRVNQPAVNRDEVEQVALQVLSAKYKDIPLNKADFLTWSKDVFLKDPLEHHRVLQEYENTVHNVEKDATELANYRQNWESIAETNVKKGVADFEEKLKSLNLTSKDLGLDLTVDKTNEGSYLWKEIVRNPDGSPNQRVVQYLFDTPVIRAENITNALMEKNLDKIIKVGPTMTSAARPQRTKPTPPPSLVSKPGNKPPEMVQDNLLDESNWDNLTSEQLDKLVEVAKKKALEESMSK